MLYKTHFTESIFTLGFLYLMWGTFMTSLKAQNLSQKNFIVVLDAGHGGHDSGNRGNGYSEKNIALEIALHIGKILEKNQNIKVIFTRKTDIFVKLVDRANIANKADADLFVSIHCDAHTSQAYGAGTFVLGLHANQRNFEVAKRENSVIFYEEGYEKNYDGFDPNNPESVIGLTLMQETYLDQSIVAAATIQKSFVANLSRKDRTVKQAGFVVLKYTYMPSVLVETGFLTNKKEGAYLNSKKGQDQMSTTIAKAIINYKNELGIGVEENEIFLEAKVVDVPVKTVPSKIDSKIYFRVQIAASKSRIEAKSYNFKGLSPIYREKEGDLYRYYFSKETSYKKVLKLKRKAEKKGYKSAFVVSFNGNEKIKLDKSLGKAK
ncbi:MAG: N-acetylmuramoyl-L-alanine amidase [Polaribacter sp.]